MRTSRAGRRLWSERPCDGLAQGREQDSTPCVRLRFDPSLIDYELADLLAMPREELEELAWRLHEGLAHSLVNRAGEELDDQFAPAVE